MKISFNYRRRNTESQKVQSSSTEFYRNKIDECKIATDTQKQTENQNANGDAYTAH